MIIDAHAHCGIQDKYPPQDLDDYLSYAKGSEIRKVVCFPPVMEIYDRYDANFSDTTAWQLRRKKANEYLLTIQKPDVDVIPYFFIWNDFAIEQLTPRHKGIKWHRHAGEPVYHYDDPRCKSAMDEIRQRNMPIILEEELGNTIKFINELAKAVTIIIPHLGSLNGGYEQIRDYGIWEKKNVYADTALASIADIHDYITRYGYEKLLFGSDFPFGDPKEELAKLFYLNLPENHMESILGQNVTRLLADSNT